MSVKFINNFTAKLVNQVSETDTTFVLDTPLPALTSPDYFLLTLFNKVGATESGWEIVKVTDTGAIGGTTITVVRAQEGTTAKLFTAGTKVEMRLTAGVITDVEVQLSVKAPLASPVFTGIPTAPTAAANANTTQLATTEFVTTANNNIQIQLNTKAPLISPALTGTPTAPTATAGTSTTQLATTEFVTAAITQLNALIYAGL
jgi:hypothetical protein